MDENCPLPTPEDRLFFLLTSLKTSALQVVHGRLFGMVQGKAKQWIHVLLPARLAARRTLGDAPARSLPALAQRLGVSEAEAATVRMAPAARGCAHVTFLCEAATFVLLMCGRRSLETLVAEGQVVLEGDHDLIAAFRQWFQGM